MYDQSSVELYRKIWVGKKIEIIEMVGEPDYTGREGIVTHVDDELQLHGTWGGLAIQLDRDLVAPVLN